MTTLIKSDCIIKRMEPATSAISSLEEEVKTGFEEAYNRVKTEGGGVYLVPPIVTPQYVLDERGVTKFWKTVQRGHIITDSKLIGQEDFLKWLSIQPLEVQKYTRDNLLFFVSKPHNIEHREILY